MKKDCRECKKQVIKTTKILGKMLKFEEELIKELNYFGRLIVRR